MSAVDLLNLLIAALLQAGVYAAMSVGMTIIYGVMKIVNLAHAGFLMLGAYFVYELYARFHIDALVGVVLVFPAFFIIGRSAPSAFRLSGSWSSVPPWLLWGAWSLSCTTPGSGERSVRSCRTAMRDESSGSMWRERLGLPSALESLSPELPEVCWP